MNQNSLKRSRQSTVLEFFTKSQRPKIELSSEMSTKESEKIDVKLAESDEEKKKKQMRNLLASAAERRINSCSNSPASDTTEIVQETPPEENPDSINNSGSFHNSDDLFTESDELFKQSEDFFKEGGSTEEWIATVFTPITEDPSPKAILKKLTDANVPLPQLQPSEKHSIMFRPHILDGCSPRPFPTVYKDRWDESHVRMPCSPCNRYPMETSNGEHKVESRWDVIVRSLNRRIESSICLEKAIMTYNRQYLNKWDFRGLHSFVMQHLDANHKEIFFDYIIPGMIELALQLPSTYTQPPPLLKKSKDHCLTMSQKQIACLLANAFFCTFPRRNQISRFRHTASDEYSSYPSINFNRLFIGTKNGVTQRNCEKLKCLLNYFAKVLTKEPTGTVSFHRRCVENFPDWSLSTKDIQDAVVRCDGVIETEGEGMLQVDFANKFVGGGVLSGGCVQEEIRFIICPELIISRLFTEAMSDSEALVITGAEQYSKYKGYADNFLFDGDFEDETPRDSWGRRQTQIVAIDALYFKKSTDQFQLKTVTRELNKAYVGFFDPDSPQDSLSAIATGNWGCGAFRGSPYLKFLIQLMAASECNRSILYFTFGNQTLQKDLSCMHHFIKKQKLTVGDIWGLLEMYCTSTVNVPEKLRINLFDFIYNTHITT